MLSDEDRRECMERLAARMRIEAVPETVANNLPDDFVYYAHIRNDEESWNELEVETRRLLRVYRGGSAAPASPSNRGERGGPQEIEVELSEYSRKRAQAFSEVAVALAESHPKVQRFRRRYLHGRLLTNDEAAAFLENQGGLYGTGFVMKRLRKLADKLAWTYRWREGDATWFVLTGHAPPVRPVKVRVAISESISESINDYHPNTAEIWLTADAWVDAKEVEQAFRNAQRQILGGDARPLPERTLEAVKFVARRMREHGKESWRERWEAWNSTCPTCPDGPACPGYPKCQKSWRYKDFRGFRQTFVRFTHRTHNWPKYKQLHEPSPYQVWRDDWVRKGTDEATTG
jgi:hypothetical protein